jgi:hypothetical protein
VEGTGTGTEGSSVQPWTPQNEEFSKHREQAWQDRQSSSDEFDKNLLTFSSSALGLSLAFIKDIVPLNHATYFWLLYTSWICLVGCIMATIFSYPLSVKALDLHLVHLDEYYIKGNQKYLNPTNRWSSAVTGARVIGGGFFLLGIVATVLFVCMNLLKGITK